MKAEHGGLDLLFNNAGHGIHSDSVASNLKTDAVAPGYHRNAIPWLKALANHRQLLLMTPATPPLLTQ